MSGRSCVRWVCCTPGLAELCTPPDDYLSFQHRCACRVLRRAALSLQGRVLSLLHALLCPPGPFHAERLIHANINNARPALQAGGGPRVA